MNKQYKVISSSPNSCSERFTGTKEECEQWITDNKHRFPGYVTLKIQPAEESAKWERDFDINSGNSIYEQMNNIDDNESLNDIKKLKESTSDTTQIQIPRKIKNFVDEMCYDINSSEDYNEDLWDRGTGRDYHLYGKSSSMHADWVMEGVMSEFDDILNTQEKELAVYCYVEFLEEPLWVDDDESLNEKYNVRTHKDVKKLTESSEMRGVTSAEVTTALKELKKNWGGVLRIKNGAVKYTTEERDFIRYAKMDELVSAINADNITKEELADDPGIVIDYFTDEIGIHHAFEISDFRAKAKTLDQEYFANSTVTEATSNQD